MRFIRLTGGYWAIVDEEDYDRVNRWKWHARKGGNSYYAARTMTLPGGKRRTRFLHHEVLGGEPGGGLVVDHMDGNSLDCRKRNLRICTRAQNNISRGPRRDSQGSKYKGVRYCRPWGVHKGGWSAGIKFNGKSYYLGYFKDEFSAVKAYNVWVYRLHGKYAYLNKWEGETHRMMNDERQKREAHGSSAAGSANGKMCVFASEKGG